MIGLFRILNLLSFRYYTCSINTEFKYNNISLIQKLKNVIDLKYSCISRALSVKQDENMPRLNHEVTTPSRKATLGMGCFWASDALFGATPGVLRTRVGYSGGTTIEPNYQNMDHTEVIEIDFDPKTISFEDILTLFWNNHEYGLTEKIKKQYTSLILYHDEEQKTIAKISLKEEQHKHKIQLITSIEKAGIFYAAEDYHQKYRLQQHGWLCEAIGLNPQLLQTSHIAARLNGYLIGVGTEENLIKDIKTLGLPEKIAKYVQKHHEENKGGSLYC